MHKDIHPDVSVVIPVYNSEDTLHELLRRLSAVIHGVCSSWEIVLIDDGSTDNSWKILAESEELHPGQIIAIQLMRNFGQHNALMCGMRHVRGRLIITMDDDLQTPPEEVPKLLERIECGDLDLVYGEYHRKKHERWRNVGSTVINMFYRFVFQSTNSVTSFRIMQRHLVDQVLSYDLNFTYLDGLLAWNTKRIGTVVVEHHPRGSGKSGYSLSRLFLLAMNLFTNFTLLPLQVVSIVGFVFALIGLTLGSYYTFAAVFGAIDTPGFASTIVAIFVLGGGQMLALGVLGEYVGRLHLNVNRKPQYAIRTVLPVAEAVREISPHREACSSDFRDTD